MWNGRLASEAEKEKESVRHSDFSPDPSQVEPSAGKLTT